MPRPTPKKPETKVKVKKRTTRAKSKVRAKVPKKSYIPKRIQAEVRALSRINESNRFELPLHTQIGHTELQPFAWVSLDTDQTMEESFKLYGSKGGNFKPVTYGLKSITLTNESGKYPLATFDLYVPDYKNQLEVGGAFRADHTSETATLDKFRIGSRFSVKWGYSAAHTLWRNLRVVERGISFEEGTAILSVKGLIGSRLLATTTAEVFSNTYGYPAVEQMASLVDMSVDYRELLEDEYFRLVNEEETKDIIIGGSDLGFGLSVASQRADVEMYFNPELGDLKFSTPFKKELIKRGQKPTKMVYGYPSSNIARVGLETKFPKKRGTSPRGGKPNNQKQNGITGDSSKGKVEFTTTVAGPYNLPNETVYIGPGIAQARGYWLFSQYPTDDHGKNPDTSKPASDLNIIANAKKRWRPSSGYTVSLAYNSAGEPILDPANNKYRAVVVQKTIKLKKGFNVLDYVTREVSKSEYNQIAKDVIRGTKFVEISGTAGANNENLTVYIYEVAQENLEQRRAREEATKKEDVPTSTVEAKVSEDPDAPEGEETKDVYVWQDAPNTGLASMKSFNIGRGNRLEERYKTRKAELEAQARQLSNDKGVLHRVSEYTEDEYLNAKIEVWAPFTPKTRKDPGKPNAGEEEQENTSDTSSSDPNDPNSTFEPVSQAKGVGSARSRKALTKLTIDLKAGDWTMRVGKLIEMVDLYKKLDGVWYIAKEEHTISASGFSTQITCHKATTRQKNSYGKHGIKGTGRNSSKGGDSTRKATGNEKPNIEEQQDGLVFRDLDKHLSNQEKQRLAEEKRQRIINRYKDLNTRMFKQKI